MKRPLHCQSSRKPRHQLMRLILNLLEPCQPTHLALNVLNQPRHQSKQPPALRALELILVVCRRVEVLIESVDGAEGTMTKVAFVCIDSRIERQLGGLIANYDRSWWALSESMGDRNGGCYIQGANGRGDLMARAVVAGS